MFGSRKPIQPRAVVNAPKIRFTTKESELLRLGDPTLFALPHARGFAAAAWRQWPDRGFILFRWTEPPQLLSLPIANLGGAFLRFVQTNTPPKVELETLAPPAATTIEAPSPQTSLRQHSHAVAGGRLANRPWLNPPVVLRSWPAPDLLTNSIIRVVVDPGGQVFSLVLLPPGSGSIPADQFALETARAARFAPLPPGADGQVTGFLIFEWHTLPMPATQSPTATP